MQQNEQLSENTNEEAQIGEDSTQAAATQTTESVAENSKSNENPVITDSQATIKIEGQEFELEAAFADDDKLLKTILQPHFASVENANITRDVKEGKLIITIVKKAQHKGWKQPKSCYLRYDTF